MTYLLKLFGAEVAHACSHSIFLHSIHHAKSSKSDFSLMRQVHQVHLKVCASVTNISKQVLQVVEAEADTNRDRKAEIFSLQN